jgi:hypothetical protein
MILTVAQQPGQSIYDMCGQTYQTLDMLVKMAQDNNVTSFSTIPQQVPYSYDDTLVKFEGNTNIYVTDLGNNRFFDPAFFDSSFFQ